ncbi:hypothetical protein MHBO_000085 [Bonamia ostreae]|uniref:Dynamin-type G domain-containing protein n=1 Tax=Bonamia ostreae TaxID=126728 RepID=A0ABV2AEF2_9EUKA
MQKLVPVTNKLQDIFSTLHSSPLLLDLPQIVVVGNQSSGKSSVLESFVGRDFLPRNKGICTRRPLILQLVSSKEAVREYGVFLHQEEKRYSDFSKIREEIINLTEKEAGKGKGVNERPIVLKVFSEKFIDLTLVDLPGITKVAVGDQPTDIEEKIRGIVKSYAEKPNTLILAVIPANVDIATSDALKIAKELDPHSKRTVGVLTKVDLMDKGESVRDILGGKVFPLRHGYVAVRNRSQSEIALNVSVAEGLERERRFFADNALYSALAEHTGSARLAERLSRILVAHIRAFLPGLRLHVRRMSAEVEKRLRKFGADPSDGKGAKPATLLAAISKYANKFNDAIEGKEKDAIAKKELYGGARISKIFHQDFAAQVLRIDPFDQLRNEEISTAIRNAKVVTSTSGHQAVSLCARAVLRDPLEKPDRAPEGARAALRRNGLQRAPESVPELLRGGAAALLETEGENCRLRRRRAQGE